MQWLSPMVTAQSTRQGPHEGQEGQPGFVEPFD